MLMVIIFPCYGSREQMCFLDIYVYVYPNIYIFGPRISFFLFFFLFSSDYLHCNAVTYIQGETFDKYLLWEGRHTSMFLRRLEPVRQQHTFQLNVKMQIIQTSVHVKVRLGRTLIRSEIKLKSLCFSYPQSIMLARNCVLASQSCTGKSSHDIFVTCSDVCCPHVGLISSKGYSPSNNRKMTQKVAAAVTAPMILMA